MKIMKFRLLAMIITLAAVTATTNSNAQRRSTSDNSNAGKVENARTGNKSNIERKSADRDNVKDSQATSRSVKSNSDVRRNPSSAKKETKEEVSRSADYKRKVAKNAEAPRRTTGNSAEPSRSNGKPNYNANRAAVKGNSERYNLNSNDIRYKPNREYKGSDKYWSSDYRSGNRGNNNSKVKYNYNNYDYWDKNWESYRWNHSSWTNYYAFYNPYSYRNNKHYYHHNYYGHVIRKFVHRPQVYVHNNIKYYCYDGNFFRYRRGVGYILVDMPFGMSFEYLPNNYEQVYINGYRYFRVENLFFERSNLGFQLVYYPERYYAYNNGYSHEGFRFNDMNY